MFCAHPNFTFGNVYVLQGSSVLEVSVDSLSVAAKCNDLWFAPIFLSLRADSKWGWDPMCDDEDLYAWMTDV